MFIFNLLIISTLCYILIRYGRIRDIDIKAPSRPPAFAFITFDDYRDAEDAIRARDGYSFDGLRLRVELCKAERRGRMDDRDSGRRGGGGRRTDYGVIVTGLPRSCSWQVSLTISLLFITNTCFSH